MPLKLYDGNKGATLNNADRRKLLQHTSKKSSCFHVLMPNWFMIKFRYWPHKQAQDSWLGPSALVGASEFVDALLVCHVEQSATVSDVCSSCQTLSTCQVTADDCWTRQRLWRQRHNRVWPEHAKQFCALKLCRNICGQITRFSIL